MPQVADMIEIRVSGGKVHLYLSSDEIVNKSSSIDIDDDLVNDIDTDGIRALDLRTRFSELVRLESRALHMPEHDRARPPAWSLSVPRLFRDMLDLHGITTQSIIDALDTYSGWEGASLPGSDEIELSGVMVQSGRLLGTLALSSGAGTVLIRSTSDEDGACTVVLDCIDLPETVLVALPGRPLDEIVEHPDLDASRGHVVRQVQRRLTNGSREIRLLLEPDFVWGGEPPEGVDVAWRDIREGRRMLLA